MRLIAIAAAFLAPLATPALLVGAGTEVVAPVKKVTIHHGAAKDAFKGDLRAKEFGDSYEAPGCRRRRQVVIKRRQPGRDKVVNRDLTNDRGLYYMRNLLTREKFHTGRFRAKVVEVIITAEGKPDVVCEAGMSKVIRIR